MYVLEKLWRGEITPSEKFMRHGGEYHKLMAALCKTEEQLESELSPAAKAALRRYQEIQSALQAIENQENFIGGFRLGAGLILDIVNDYSGDFQYPTDE